MSLDNLISKYLDGELNQEEDTLLRHYLANDKEAKEEFDIAVELHHAMQKDAKSIKTPVDVLSETEDRVMMQIINESKANVLNLSKPKKSRLNYKYISAAAVILFMFAIGKISDYQLGYQADYAQTYHDEYRSVDKNMTFANGNNSESLVENNTLVLEVPKEKSYPNIRTSQVSQRESNYQIASQDISSGMLIAQELNNPMREVKTIYSDNDDFADFREANAAYNAMSNSLLNKKNYDEPKMPNILPGSNIGSGSGSNFNYYDDVYQTTTKNVNISFFAASDYYNSGFNKIANSAISNYSLSISYTISENFDFGIEFGSLEYLSNLDITIKVPKPSGNQMIEVGSMPTEYINLEKTLTIDNQLFWLSAFAEHNIIPATELSWFNLSARLGFGASNSGALFYGRVRGKVELYNNLFLTVGTEMRYMYLNFGERFGGNTWSKSGFLVYGIEYNLR